MIPSVLTLIGRYLLMVELGLMNSLWGLILPYIAAGLAFAIFLLTGFFFDLPEELFEAARMDGGTELQMYRLIALPLSRPIMAIVGLLTFLVTTKPRLGSWLKRNGHRLKRPKMTAGKRESSIYTP